MNFGPPIKLCTYEEISLELTEREDLPCLIAYRDRDGAYHIYDNIDRDCGIGETLRKLADWIEDGD